MAVAQQISPYIDPLAGDAFDRVAPAINAWIDVFNQKARPGGIIRRDFGKIGDV
jgi:hypothetical protein